MTITHLPDEPFAHADLPRLGLSRRDLYRLVDEGAVRRVAPGAFVPHHLPDCTETRAAAVARIVAPHQVVVDRTAAIIHGVDALVYAEHDLVVPLETCALRGHTRSRLTGVDGRVRDLARSDVMRIGGVRVTTPLRTACDLGCHLRRREAFAAMCALARAHGLTQRELGAELPRFRGRRGVVQLKQLVPLVDPRVESAREAWTLLAIGDAGLPLPEPQVVIEIDGVPTYRLDLAYRHAHVCVEYDGVEAHESTPEQRERDRVRRQWLRDHGWTVIVVRAGDFSGERLDHWLRVLREALAPAYSNRRW